MCTHIDIHSIYLCLDHGKLLLVTSERKLCLYNFKHEECTLQMYPVECLPHLVLSLVEDSKKFPLKIPNNYPILMLLWGKNPMSYVV